MIETFEVDMDSAHDLKKLISKLVKRKKQLQGLTNQDMAAEVAHRNKDEKRYQRYKKWLSKVDDDEGEHYVYAHCDTRFPLNVSKSARDLIAAESGLTYRPFYIGKGIGERCFNTNRNDSYRKKKSSILKEDKHIDIVKVRTGMSEVSALSLESTYIKIYGIMAVNHYNWLVNLAD